VNARQVLTLIGCANLVGCIWAAALYANNVAGPVAVLLGITAWSVVVVIGASVAGDGRSR
jgi:hypothetical protein